MSEREMNATRTFVAAAAVLALGATAFAQVPTGDPCKCQPPEVDAGILVTPPCPYGSPSGQPLRMLEGLPPGSSVDSHFNVDSFFDITYRVGTPTDPNGQVQQYQGQMTLQMQGSGALQDFSRTLTLPVQIELHLPEVDLDQATASWRTEMISMQAALFGDPDFDFLRITAGTANGLPADGNTTLTELPSGDFQIDSFFDITYQIEFQGAPGGALEGFGGTTTAGVDYGNGTPGGAPCVVPTPNAGFDAHPFDCPIYPPSGAPIDIPTGTPDVQLRGDWNVDSFFDITYRIAPTGEHMYLDSGIMHMNIGSSGKDGVSRSVDVPYSRCYTLGTGGIADMLTFDAELFGDPDFDLLRITGGSQTGLPAPGQVTITELPDGNFNVDSFFDITYTIDFQGAPGGVFDGLGGSSSGSMRMQQGSPPAQTITAHGLQNTSMCNADLSLDPAGNLVISNIGSSGLDGVSIDLGEADGFGTNVFLPLPDDILWDLIWTTLDPTTAPSVKWCLGMHNQGPDVFFDITVDAFEPQEIRVTMFDDSLPVATQTFPGSHDGALVVSNIGSSGKDGVRSSCAHTSRVDSFFDITYTIDFEAGFPGSPPVSCDQLRFEIIAPPGQVEPGGPKLGQCRIVWAGLPPCPPTVITEESLHVFGTGHVALGEATMQASGGRLTVSNIGSSGCDGVSIDCPCLPCPPQCYCHPGWELDFGPPLLPGSDVFFDGYAYPLPGGPEGQDQKIFCLHMQGQQPNGTGIGFDPGSLPFEPPFIRVNLFDAGAPAGDHVFLPPYPDVLVVSGIGSSGKDGVSIDVGEDDDCNGALSVRVRNPFPTETQLPGLPIVVADEIVMCLGAPDGEEWPCALARAEFRGANIPHIALLDRFDVPEPPCPEDTNGDDVVDVNDLVNIIVFWGTNNAAADVNNDGIVDVNDLVSVITNWGPCFPPAEESPAPMTRGPKTGRKNANSVR